MPFDSLVLCLKLLSVHSYVAQGQLKKQKQKQNSVSEVMRKFAALVGCGWVGVQVKVGRILEASSKAIP